MHRKVRFIEKSTCNLQVLFSGSPCWVSADKTINYRFVKRWSTKREQYEASVSSRCITTRDCEWRVAEPATSASNSHAYSRKYSRFVRLGTLGFKTPYFRNVNSTAFILTIPFKGSVKYFYQNFSTYPAPRELWARRNQFSCHPQDPKK